MIANVIDKRERPYRWKRIQAIIEAADHDNAVEDSDQAASDASSDRIHFEQKDSISVGEAIEWASGLNGLVTLYLYDEGTN